VPRGAPPTPFSLFSFSLHFFPLSHLGIEVKGRRLGHLADIVHAHVIAVQVAVIARVEAQPFPGGRGEGGGDLGGGGRGGRGRRGRRGRVVCPPAEGRGGGLLLFRGERREVDVSSILMLGSMPSWACSQCLATSAWRCGRRGRPDGAGARSWGGAGPHHHTRRCALTLLFPRSSSQRSLHAVSLCPHSGGCAWSHTGSPWAIAARRETGTGCACKEREESTQKFDTRTRPEEGGLASAVTAARRAVGRAVRPRSGARRPVMAGIWKGGGRARSNRERDERRKRRECRGGGGGSRTADAPALSTHSLFFLFCPPFLLLRHARHPTWPGLAYPLPLISSMHTSSSVS